jgi:hypothetical protein
LPRRPAAVIQYEGPGIWGTSAEQAFHWSQWIPLCNFLIPGGGCSKTCWTYHQHGGKQSDSPAQQQFHVGHWVGTGAGRTTTRGPPCGPPTAEGRAGGGWTRGPRVTGARPPHGGGPLTARPHGPRRGPATWPLEPPYLPKVHGQFADFP